MKAVIMNGFGGPEVLEYTDIPKPVPQSGEVLVRNEYIGVGKPDYMVRSGQDPYSENRPKGQVAGNECAGTVEVVGSGVTGIKEGDKVCVNSGLGVGAYAEYIAVPQEYVTVLPQEFPMKYAPALLNYMVAWAMLNDVGRGTDGHSVYLTGGAGGIGTAVIQTAKMQNMTVIASARSDEKCEYIRKLGADFTFNSTKTAEKDAVLEFTGQKGVDLILDQLAGPRFASQFDYLADFGMIVLYNWLDGDPGLDQLKTIETRALHATAVRSFSFHVYDSNPDRREVVRQTCIRNIMEGKITPHIFKELPLSEGRYAHELLDGQKIMGKLILKP